LLLSNFVNPDLMLYKKNYCYTNLYTQKAKRAFLRIVDPQKYLSRVTGNSLKS
jgi:hypothetical protein